MLAENTDLTFKCINREDYEFIEAMIMQQTSPEEAFCRLEKLANNHIDTLRKITKDI